MASPDTSPENPHVISFENEQLGVKLELTLNHPEMESLGPRERELLERLIRAEAYTLAISMMTDRMPINEWRGTVIHAINDQHESAFNFEGYLPPLAEFLGIDIEIPSYDLASAEIHSLPPAQTLNPLI